MRIIKRVILVGALGSSLMAATACLAQEQDASNSPASIDSYGDIADNPPPRRQACPNLDSQLSQFTQSDDPAAFAASAGLTYESGTVRVIVELVGDASPDPTIYQLSVEGQYANLLQVRVPPDQLCALASDPTVARVRAPFSHAPSPG
jgi:hypothetical protein